MRRRQFLCLACKEESETVICAACKARMRRLSPCEKCGGDHVPERCASGKIRKMVVELDR